MDSKVILMEIELASYEMAEAESRERTAHKLRLSANKRLALVHIEFKNALEQAEKQRMKTQEQ